MTRVLVILALFLLSFPFAAASPAFAQSKTDKKAAAGTVSASQDPRLQAALALIDFPWKELGYEIVVRPPRRGFRAMTFTRKKRIEIYARPGDDALTLAYDIAHELGHAIDLTHNNKATRKEWMKARGIDPSTPWFGCNRCSDFKTPSGDFAETFSLILLGPEHFKGRIAPRPTSEQIPLLTRFFLVGAEAANASARPPGAGQGSLQTKQ
jgi:hypothetical protein